VQPQPLFAKCSHALHEVTNWIGMADPGEEQFLMGTKADKSATLLEVSVALEIVRGERNLLRAEVSMLREQLARETARAERSEARLHEVTMTMAELSREAILAPARSNATEVLMDGKSILRLNNPVAAQR
jgi:hypothetical protein